MKSQDEGLTDCAVDAQRDRDEHMFVSFYQTTSLHFQVLIVNFKTSHLKGFSFNERLSYLFGVFSEYKKQQTKVNSCW